MAENLVTFCGGNIATISIKTKWNRDVEYATQICKLYSGLKIRMAEVRHIPQIYFSQLYVGENLLTIQWKNSDCIKSLQTTRHFLKKNYLIRYIMYNKIKLRKLFKLWKISLITILQCMLKIKVTNYQKVLLKQYWFCV